MAKAKSTGQKDTRPRIPQPHGGALVSGAGGGPQPGSGRPSNWWREKMRELRDRWLVTAEAFGIVDDPSHPEWRRLGVFLHEAVDGKAPASVDVTSKGDKLTGVVILPEIKG